MMLALLFPGQGAQEPQAGVLWRDRPEWQVVSEVSAAADADVEAMLLHDSQDALRATLSAQLATFAASAVVRSALEAMGIRAGLVAGHSVGEYSALAAAGVLPLRAAARIVAARGRAMATACDLNPGTMYAVVGLDEDLVTAACARADDEVWIANYNGPRNHVLSGSHHAVASACKIAEELGAKRCIPLRVDGPFHTPHMLPARPALRDALGREEFGDATSPVVANVDARIHRHGADWPSLLSAQLCHPVRWHHTIEVLWREGVRTFVEVGPGRGLTNMVKRSHPDARAVAVSCPEDLDGLAELVTDAAPQAEQFGEDATRVRGLEAGVVHSPVAGEVRLEGGTPTAEGVLVSAGEIVAYVNGVAVEAPRSGWLLDWTAPGTRVSEGEFLMRIGR